MPTFNVNVKIETNRVITADSLEEAKDIAESFAKLYWFEASQIAINKVETEWTVKTETTR